jgi:hypothetical protein
MMSGEQLEGRQYIPLRSMYGYMGDVMTVPTLFLTETVLALDKLLLAIWARIFVASRERGDVWVRVAESDLIECTRTTERGVEKAIANGVKLGIIEKRKRGRENEYRLQLDALSRLPRKPKRVLKRHSGRNVTE